MNKVFSKHSFLLLMKLGTIACIACIHMSVSAQISFRTSQNTMINVDLRQKTLVDVNHDGILDLVSQNRSAFQSIVSFGNGHGEYLHDVVSNVWNESIIDILDFTHSGSLDMLALNSGYIFFFLK